MFTSKNCVELEKMGAKTRKIILYSLCSMENFHSSSGTGEKPSVNTVLVTYGGEEFFGTGITVKEAGENAAKKAIEVTSDKEAQEVETQLPPSTVHLDESIDLLSPQSSSEKAPKVPSPENEPCQDEDEGNDDEEEEKESQG